MSDYYDGYREGMAQASRETTVLREQLDAMLKSVADLKSLTMPPPIHLTIPSARKPMTPKERSELYIELEETIGPDAHLLSFLSGIAAAERYHGIEAKDPEPSGDYVLGEGSPYFKENP